MVIDNVDAEGVLAQPPKQRSCAPCGYLCAVAGGLLLAAVFLPLVDFGARSAAREMSRRMACTNNLKTIGMAMLDYEQDNRCFPPAYITDAKGRPLYSWRVLILPYMEHDDLYKRVWLDESWDSPHNRSVLQDEAVARLFQCPSAENSKDETSYVMIVGPNSISDGPHSMRFPDMKDGSSNIILIAEIKNSGIHWAEPCDLNFDEMSLRINAPDSKGIGSYHPGMAGVCLADGHVQFFGDGFDPMILKSLTTISGGEDVSKFNKLFNNP